MQELGLQALCIEDNGMHKYIRKLLALPLLPGNKRFLLSSRDLKYRQPQQHFRN